MILNLVNLITRKFKIELIGFYFSLGFSKVLSPSITFKEKNVIRFIKSLLIITVMYKRSGVARVVLQSPSSFIS